MLDALGLYWTLYVLDKTRAQKKVDVPGKLTQAHIIIRIVGEVLFEYQASNVKLRGVTEGNCFISMQGVRSFWDRSCRSKNYVDIAGKTPRSCSL